MSPERLTFEFIVTNLGRSGVFDDDIHSRSFKFLFDCGRQDFWPARGLQSELGMVRGLGLRV